MSPEDGVLLFVLIAFALAILSGLAALFWPN
jgi:hypothetical protein